MELVPCSKAGRVANNIMQIIVAQVGHVYKQRTPYSYPGGQELTTGCNLWRVAATWLGNTLQYGYPCFCTTL